MFTRKGDSGETESKGGERMTKSSIAVEVEGMIDETSSSLGFSIVKSKWEDITSDLQRCQELIFNMGEHILIEGTGRIITKKDVEWVEERTLRYREEIGRIDLFVLPGGSEESVALHMSRVVARRLERSVVGLNSQILSLKPSLLFATSAIMKSNEERRFANCRITGSRWDDELRPTTERSSLLATTRDM